MRGKNKRKITDILKHELKTENLYRDLIVQTTHTNDEHTCKNDTDLVERLMAMAKIPNLITFSVSTFADETSAERHITKAIRAYKNEIARWLQDPESETTLNITLKTGSDTKPAGHGFKNTGSALLYYETPATTVVLRKNKNTARKFCIVTAFPDINVRTATRINKDPLRILKSTQAWNNETTLFRYYLTCLSEQTNDDIMLHCPYSATPHLDFIQQTDATHRAIIQFYPNDDTCIFKYTSIVPSDATNVKSTIRPQVPPALAAKPYRPTDQRYYDIDTDPDSNILEAEYPTLFQILKNKRKQFNQTERNENIMATMNDIIKRGEIYYIFKDSINPTIGSEQEAGRPAIIVSNDMNNRYSKIVDVVFLTTQDKKPLPTHVCVDTAKKASIALCEQIHPIDKHRIGNRCGIVPPENMHKIDEALAISLGINVDVNGTRLLKAWCEAYDKKGNDIQMPKAVVEPETTPVPEPAPAPKPEPVDVKQTPEYIRMMAERDVYKNLYMELLAQR